MNLEFGGYVDDGGPFYTRVEPALPCRICGDMANEGRCCEYKETGEDHWIGKCCIESGRKGQI